MSSTINEILITDGIRNFSKVDDFSNYPNRNNDQRKVDTYTKSNSKQKNEFNPKEVKKYSQEKIETEISESEPEEDITYKGGKFYNRNGELYTYTRMKCRICKQPTLKI